SKERTFKNIPNVQRILIKKLYIYHFVVWVMVKTQKEKKITNIYYFVLYHMNFCGGKWKYF
ncbi:hypothetical protein, partial [Vibrio cholerae]|uniref:hypothetical protein n=1 Tax=Vibrio cholerae TaxID=666 RepID=UPI001F1D9980